MYYTARDRDENQAKFDFSSPKNTNILIEIWIYSSKKYIAYVLKYILHFYR